MIQLADRSIVYLVGVLEDILVQVNTLPFPIDFYIIDTKDDKTNMTSHILFVDLCLARLD